MVTIKSTLLLFLMGRCVWCGCVWERACAAHCTGVYQCYLATNYSIANNLWLQHISFHSISNSDWVDMFDMDIRRHPTKTVINCELYRCAMCRCTTLIIMMRVCQAFQIHHEICMVCEGHMCMIGCVVIKSAIENWQLILLLLLRFLSKYVFISFSSIQCDCPVIFLYRRRFLIWNYASDLCDWSWTVCVPTQPSVACRNNE